jgi:hypothetical protein
VDVRMSGRFRARSPRVRQLYFSTFNNIEPVGPEADLLRGTGYWTVVYSVFSGWNARPVQCAKKH